MAGTIQHAARSIQSTDSGPNNAKFSHMLTAAGRYEVDHGRLRLPSGWVRNHLGCSALRCGLQASPPVPPACLNFDDTPAQGIRGLSEKAQDRRRHQSVAAQTTTRHLEDRHRTQLQSVSPDRRQAVAHGMTHHQQLRIARAAASSCRASGQFCHRSLRKRPRQ